MATADVAQDLVLRRHKSTTFFLVNVFEHPAHVVVKAALSCMVLEPAVAGTHQCLYTRSNKTG